MISEFLERKAENPLVEDNGQFIFPVEAHFLPSPSYPEGCTELRESTKLELLKSHRDSFTEEL